MRWAENFRYWVGDHVGCLGDDVGGAGFMAGCGVVLRARRREGRCRLETVRIRSVRLAIGSRERVSAME